MYDTEIALDRNFMRRMIRAYEQDLLQLVNETPNHPGGDWAQEHLQMLELLRQQTFSPLKQSITFWSWHKHSSTNFIQLSTKLMN